MGSIRSTTEEEKEERRHAIMEAAKKRFQRFGFSKTTVEEIAADTGISKGTIYLYFPTKEDIFTEIMANEALELERLMYHAVKDEKSVRKQLEMIFIGSIEYMEQHPFLHSTLRRDVEMVTPRLLKHIFSIEDRYVSVIEDYVRRGIETGEIESHNPRLIAYVLYKIFEAFTYGSRLGEEGFDKGDVEELIPLLINKGLAPAKPAAAGGRKR
ncbi:MAG: TetR/AcrR family transcriptional regulator [Actinobacteria bacterium]|nr:TetR/AcrR family transcriptional regulator [Actinomycetota bacterium]